LWHGISQAVRVARRKHGIKRHEPSEPEPTVVEESEDVDGAKEEVLATPTARVSSLEIQRETVDDLAESEPPRLP
jgi:hypothetical protein